MPMWCFGMSPSILVCLVLVCLASAILLPMPSDTGE